MDWPIFIAIAILAFFAGYIVGFVLADCRERR